MIQIHIDIQAELARVYEGFRDLHHWTRTLPDVLGVVVRYDDGLAQEFTMTVSRSAGPETVRGVRFCDPHRSISLFQPEPPPGFSRMVGKWEFEARGSSTRVIAKRWFTLADSDPRDAEQVADTLLGFLDRNLNLFKRTIEAGHGQG
jgi:hypothetical protein